jgi:RHS repeat-associated protein
VVKTFSFSFLSVIDDPLICRYNNADYYYHTNHQGNVTELLGQSGGIVKTYRYDAFGNILQETGPAWNRGFTYTGRERHYRSGLYYYRFRWYDSQTGRFTTQDPIGFDGGINLYAYCGDDPVNWVDPLGWDYLVYTTKKKALYWYYDSGELVGTWEAVSGTSKYRPLPSGAWKITKRPQSVPPSHKDQESYCDGMGRCWWVPLEALFDLHGHRGFGIHPDGYRPGTRGCIGLKAQDTSDFRFLLNEYIKQNGCIDVQVE